MSDHEIFMDMALNYARFSKCVSMSVGCIAVNGRGRLISTGVNGTPAGFDNCCDVHADRGVAHSAWSDKFEIHAEMNCLLEMARSPITFSAVDFYVTHCPCSNCLKHMLGLNSHDAKVRRIIYNEVYYRTPIELLTEQKDTCKLFGVELISIQEAVANDSQR